MKYRKDFVTNSSSSSFVCDVCGYETSGYDMSYRDAGMYQCVNGHEFCIEHAVKLSREETLKLILEHAWNSRWDYKTKETITIPENELNEMGDEELMELVIESYSEVPEEVCPICSMQYYHDGDILKYLLKEKGTTEKEVFEEIRVKFSTYEQFKQYVNG